MGLQEFFNTKIARVFHRHSQQVPKRLAIALSGGVDSMALTHLMHNYSLQHGIQLFPITINHNLRPTSKMEISLIKRELEKLGVLRNYRTMDIHLSTAPLSVSSEVAKEIEEEARVKRYAAITELCSGLGVKHILLGHHLDDQLETYCIRLLKNSGILGLAGMSEWSKAPVNTMPERLQLVRPLLDVRKERLYEYCLDNGVEWVQDYTNFDENYGLRNVVRKYLHDNKAIEERMLTGYTAAMKFNHRTDLKVKRLHESLGDRIRKEYGTIIINTSKAQLDKCTDLVLAKFLFKLCYQISPSRNYHYSFNKLLDAVPRLQEDTTFSLLKLQWTIKHTDEDDVCITITRQTPPTPITYTFILEPGTSTDYFLFDNTYWFKVHNKGSDLKHYTMKTLSPEDKSLLEEVPKDYKYSLYKNTPVLIDHEMNAIVAMPIHHESDIVDYKLKENIYTF